MDIFWLEYLHFIVAIFAILVSISSAALFLLTYRYERQLQTFWRALGFTALAVAYLLFIIERKEALFEGAALVIWFLGFVSIYKGVRAEPKLSHLRSVGKGMQDLRNSLGIAVKEQKRAAAQSLRSINWSENVSQRILVLLAIVALVLLFVFAKPYVAPILVIGAFLAILATIPIQIKRYQGEPQAHNLYPLLGYISLLAASVALFFWRLPSLDVVFLRKLSLDFSSAWQLGILFTFLGFLFLALWAWTYIKVRVFLRTYVVFLSIAILVSSLASLVLMLLVFNIVERNNLQLMAQGASTQEIVVNDRLETALFVSRTLATDPIMIGDVALGDYQGILSMANRIYDTSGADTLRVYNDFAEVIVSPSEPRDRARVFNDDPLIAFAIMEKKHIRSLDLVEGVLSPVLVARALTPVISDGTVVGVVEVGYVFDNAFVDFAKAQTGLDVTIYANDRRSATTILTLDGVSRWVGSEETEQAVLDQVLRDGGDYRAVVDRLGEIYYSAFTPIRNVNGEVIGMIAVGTPTALLREDIRQQLLSTFLILTLISFLATLLGYYSVQTVKNKSMKQIVKQL